MENQETALKSLKEISDKAFQVRAEFNTSMATMSGSILTVFITGISLVSSVTLKMNWLILSAICLTLILIVTTLYTVVEIEARKVHYTLELYLKDTEKETNKNLTKQGRDQLVSLYNLLKKYPSIDKLSNIILRYSHWIIFPLFAISLSCLLVFTVSNLKSNKETSLQVQQEKILDIEIKKLQLEELKRSVSQ